MPDCAVRYTQQQPLLRRWSVAGLRPFHRSGSVDSLLGRTTMKPMKECNLRTLAGRIAARFLTVVVAVAGLNGVASAQQIQASPTSELLGFFRPRRGLGVRFLHADLHGGWGSGDASRRLHQRGRCANHRPDRHQQRQLRRLSTREVTAPALLSSSGRRKWVPRRSFIRGE